MRQFLNRSRRAEPRTLIIGSEIGRQGWALSAEIGLDRWDFVCHTALFINTLQHAKKRQNTCLESITCIATLSRYVLLARSPRSPGPLLAAPCLAAGERHVALLGIFELHDSSAKDRDRLGFRRFPTPVPLFSQSGRPA